MRRYSGKKKTGTWFGFYAQLNVPLFPEIRLINILRLNLSKLVAKSKTNESLEAKVSLLIVDRTLNECNLLDH